MDGMNGIERMFVSLATIGFLLLIASIFALAML